MLAAGGIPLQYAVVCVLGAEHGAYTDSEGYFRLRVKKNDSIVVGNFGYETIHLPALGVLDSILLSEETIEIPPVTVLPERAYRDKAQVGYHRQKRNYGMAFGPGMRVATLVHNPRGVAAYIDYICFQISDKGKRKDSRLRVNLLSVGTKKGKPTMPLLENGIIIARNKLRRNTRLDIRHLRLQFPPEGCFVMLEWLGSRPQDSDSIDLYPCISGHQETENRGGIWYASWFKGWSRFPGRHGTLNVSLKVRYPKKGAQ